MPRPRQSKPQRTRQGDPRARLVHESFMRQAIEEARMARHIGEVPVGALVVYDGEIVGQGFNQPIHTCDPSGHAEVVALRMAARTLGNYRLTGATLYVTVEPCLMCVGLIVSSRITTVVYGAPEPKCGAVTSILNVEELPLNHRFDVVTGVLEAECRKMLQDFFKFRREGV